MKTNLRYVGKQLGIVLLLAVIAIIIFCSWFGHWLWSDWRWKESMVHSLSGYLVRNHWEANRQIRFK